MAADIERYCATHADACDSIDGLAWWVVLQRYKDVRGEISAAVDQLVKRGVLQRYVLQDGSVVFGCCKQKRK